MQLRGRLNLIASKVPKCRVAGDIGTDHAYIPIYLVHHDICEKVIAADVKKGPVDAANRNIESFGMEDRIETRLGDGLEPLAEGECDTVIIAGMGGVLVTEILAREINKAKAAPYLVLQPMNSLEVLRQWLFENGFVILDEELTDEGEKIYAVICAKWTGEKKTADELYYHIGYKLIEKRDPLLSRYIANRIKQADKILGGLKKTEEDFAETEKKYTYLKRRLLELAETI